MEPYRLDPKTLDPKRLDPTKLRFVPNRFNTFYNKLDHLKNEKNNYTKRASLLLLKDNNDKLMISNGFIKLASEK